MKMRSGLICRAAWLLMGSSLPIALVSCGDSNSGGGNFVNPTGPSVSFINPPSTVRIGTNSSTFTTQISTPAGARASSYVQLRTVNPSGIETQNQFFDANQFGVCAGGATSCSNNGTVFSIPSNGSTGTWTFTVTAFDQQNRSGSQTLFITAIP